MSFACQTAITASAMLISTAANIRAVSTMSRLRTVIWSTRAAVNWTVALPEKNLAMSV